MITCAKLAVCDPRTSLGESLGVRLADAVGGTSHNSPVAQLPEIAPRPQEVYPEGAHKLQEQSCIRPQSNQQAAKEDDPDQENGQILAECRLRHGRLARSTGYNVLWAVWKLPNRRSIVTVSRLIQHIKERGNVRICTRCEHGKGCRHHAAGQLFRTKAGFRGCSSAHIEL
jgi:hypothetical protein